MGNIKELLEKLYGRNESIESILKEKENTMRMYEGELQREKNKIFIRSDELKIKSLSDTLIHARKDFIETLMLSYHTKIEICDLEFQQEENNKGKVSNIFERAYKKERLGIRLTASLKLNLFIAEKIITTERRDQYLNELDEIIPNQNNEKSRAEDGHDKAHNANYLTTRNIKKEKSKSILVKETYNKIASVKGNRNKTKNELIDLTANKLGMKYPAVKSAFYYQPKKFEK